MESSKEHGIDAVNQEFKRYEQVEKNQNYNLTEKEGEDEFDDDYQIKTCDLNQFFNGGEEGKSKFAKELGEALEGIGFAVLTGHGVDTSLYEKSEELITEIFEEISREERMKFRAERFGSVNQGYFPVKETTIIHPDSVEGWVFCRRAFDMPGNRNPNFDANDF